LKGPKELDPRNYLNGAKLIDHPIPHHLSDYMHNRSKTPNHQAAQRRRLENLQISKQKMVCKVSMASQNFKEGIVPSDLYNSPHISFDKIHSSAKLDRSYVLNQALNETSFEGADSFKRELGL